MLCDWVALVSVRKTSLETVSASPSPGFDLFAARHLAAVNSGYSETEINIRLEHTLR